MQDKVVKVLLIFEICFLTQILAVKQSTCGKLKSEIKSYKDEVENLKISLEEYELVLGKTEDVSDECNESLTCSNCLWEKKNGCGWCVLRNRCSQRKNCPSSNSTSDFWITGSDKCPKIRAVIPNSTQVTIPSTLQIVIPHLPDYDGAFICSFEVPGKTLVTKGEKNDRGITCPSPHSGNFKKIATGEDHMVVKVSVRTPNGPNIASTSNFTIYDCSRYQTCSECSASIHPCSWCVERQKCIHDASEYCRGDIIVYSGTVAVPTTRQGPGYCPRISSSGDSEKEILVPSGSKKRISLKVENIAQSQTVARFTCKVKGLPEVTAQLLGNTVHCDDISLRVLGRQPIYNLTLSVSLNGKEQLDNPQNVHIVVYNCERMAHSCGECIDLAARYGCGWCEESDSCSFKDNCKDSPWKDRKDTCKKPEIISIHPSVGLLTVKTNLTIEGVNLAKEFKDIESVTLINEEGATLVDCVPYENLFVRHSRIVCLLDMPKTLHGSNVTLRGIVEVKFARGIVAISEQRYSFVSPVIDGFQPVKGVASGGTFLTITGHNLDAGNKVEAYIGDLPCHIKSRDRSSIQCISSPILANEAAPKSGAVRVLFDGEERTSSSHFFYVADPSVRSVKGEHGADIPIGTPSGGNLIMVEGTNFDNVPSSYIYVVVDGVEYPGACTATSDTRMECLSPNIPADILNFCGGEGSLSFHYGFRMGDAESVQNISQNTHFGVFTLYPDPYLMPFNDERKIKTFKSDYLVIQGKYLDTVYNEKDFSVRVDGVECPITSLSQLQLTCRLSDAQVDDYDETKLLEVQVRVRASVEHFIGYLRRLKD